MRCTVFFFLHAVTTALQIIAVYALLFGILVNAFTCRGLIKPSKIGVQEVGYMEEETHLIHQLPLIEALL